MKVSQLRLAPCNDRSRVVGGPDPMDWLLPSLPEGWSICSFHYFVDWAKDPLAVAGPFLMTRLVEFDAGEDPDTVDTRQVLNAFHSSGFAPQYEQLRRVCAIYGKEARVILLPECDINRITNKTPIWTIAQDEKADLKIQTYPLARLRWSIQNYSGGPVPIGEKGLTLGTSAVECFLSRTDAAYPGDADAVVVDENGLVRHVIEFKKHNLAAPIDRHLAQRYYPDPDLRKYRRLEALVSDLNSMRDTDSTLGVFYYSTARSQIRLQIVEKLSAQEIEIAKDTGDLNIGGKSNLEISRIVAAGLGVPT